MSPFWASGGRGFTCSRQTVECDSIHGLATVATIEREIRMSSTNRPESDSVEALLGSRRPVPDDGFRQSLLGQTSGVVCRRRRVRRVVFSAALAGCYLAGVATTQLWTLQAEPGAGGVAVDPVDRRAESPTDREIAESFPLVPANFANIRRVSDRYLYEEGDMSRALRCYGQALDRATPEERTNLSEEDSWLLKAIKLARIEEAKHENRES